MKLDQFSDDAIAGDIGDGGTGKFVVHHGVKLASVEPLGGIFPDFSHDIGLGVEGLDAIAKFNPETGGFDFKGNV